MQAWYTTKSSYSWHYIQGEKSRNTTLMWRLKSKIMLRQHFNSVQFISLQASTIDFQIAKHVETLRSLISIAESKQKKKGL